MYSKRSICAAIALAAILTACGSSAPKDKDQEAANQFLKDILGQAAPSAVTQQSTVTPINRVLEGSLPRKLTYASMQITVTKAVISNKYPGLTLTGNDRYLADKAFASIDVTATNPLTRDQASVEVRAISLHLGDGKVYPSSDAAFSWTGRVRPQATEEGQLVFPVPPDATWAGAKLVIKEPGKEPGTLVLDGTAPPPQYPANLPPGGEATAQDLRYTVITGAVDLDADGKRVDLGKRFLKLVLRVTSNKPRYDQLVSGENFRVMAGGVPLAPIRFPIEALKAQSALEGEVLFMVPANATSVQLQVGEIGQGGTAIIPIDLSKARP